MDVWSACMIDTRIVYGFPGAGKTFYIRDSIINDYFYKYGVTLILCFERGKEEYDPETLRAKNTFIAYYDGQMSHSEGQAAYVDGQTVHSDGQTAYAERRISHSGGQKNIEEFCLEKIGEYNPDRIYVEMNTAIPGLRMRLPDTLNVTSTVTLIDWAAIDSDLLHSRQQISQMVSESQQVTFRGCPSKDLLVPYAQDFKLMNHKASYLRQDPMGFHEKAFDLFLPYSLDEQRITVKARHYLAFWLDASDHPEHYNGKLIHFPDPLELRRFDDSGSWSAGRVVMTCCMADLQFMSFELEAADSETIHGGRGNMGAAGRTTAETLQNGRGNMEAAGRTTAGTLSGGWITMDAVGRTAADEYGRRVLKLVPESVANVAAPKSAILMAGNRSPAGSGILMAGNRSPAGS